MSKHFAIIALEIILIAALGFFTNIAAEKLNINSAYVWIFLILILLMLITTTWFKVKLDSGRDLLKWRISIPDKVTFSISLSTIRDNSRFFLGLFINSILFGWLVANASIFAVRISPELSYSVVSAYYSIVNLTYLPVPLSFEIIGVFAIGFTSIVVSKRLSSTIIGLLFCTISSLIFSATHLRALPFQYITWTILGNLIFSVIFMLIGMVLYPLLNILIKQITSFWRVQPQNNA